MKTTHLTNSENMNMSANNSYEAPQVEVIEVAVEKGYATTGGIEGHASDSDDSEFGY